MCFHPFLNMTFTSSYLLHWSESVTLKTSYTWEWNVNEVLLIQTPERRLFSVFQHTVHYYYANDAHLNIFACVFQLMSALPENLPCAHVLPPHKRVRSPWAAALSSGALGNVNCCATVSYILHCVLVIITRVRACTRTLVTKSNQPKGHSTHRLH